MKKSRFTEKQIIAVLKEGEAGVTVKELCRKYGICDQKYYRWKAKYGGLAIVKSIAALHGGSVEIFSEVGHGTQVTLTFPQIKKT